MNPHLFFPLIVQHGGLRLYVVYVCNFQCAILDHGPLPKGWWWSKNGCLLDNDEFRLSFSLANTRPTWAPPKPGSFP